MIKRKIKLYMKSGATHQLVCNDEKEYRLLLEQIYHRGYINITESSITTTVNLNSLDYHTSEILNHQQTTTKTNIKNQKGQNMPE